MLRNKCCFCNGDFTDIITLKNYPISFSMSTDNNYIYNDLIFLECNNCKTIQIKELIELELLYNKPHNNNIVGETWNGHFKEFSSMINKLKNIDDTVLEIGSATNKIEQYIDNYFKWILMDPNSVSYPNKNVENINEFFTEKSQFKFKIDTIIHSHLLEHLYEPQKTLFNMSQILDDQGSIFISVPNLHSYSFDTLFLGMHFEHTYFLNESNIIYLFNNCNLEIVHKQYYKSHSIFYQLKKIKTPKFISLDFLKEFNLGYKNLLIRKIEEMKELIHNINYLIKNNTHVYIFGCHSNTQSMLYFGLNIKNIKFILDNDTEKWNKKLYGYQLICKNPEIIKEINEPFVICNVGVYTNEIKKQLLSLNKTVVIM